MNALDRLDALPRYATEGPGALKPGLERVTALLAELGDPHRTYPIVHVAGTNGKGSTASMIAAVLTVAGLRTGLHTSPHLVDVCERMRIDGVPVPTARLAALVESMAPMFEVVRPSYFEATVALAFAWFRDVGAQVAVVETGLGGRLDATNVVNPAISVITDIAMDHAEILGATITAIAREKAGILKPGVPAVAVDSGPEAVAVLRDVAARIDAPLAIVSTFPSLRLDLPGAHQDRNAALAVAAARRLAATDVRFAGVTETAISRGLAETRRLSGLRARFETVSTGPLVIVDVAHNPDGLDASLSAFDQVSGLSAPGAGGAAPRRVLFFSVMADKDVGAMARRIARSGLEVVPVALAPARALAADHLETALRAAGCPVAGMLSGPEAVPGWIGNHLGPGDAALVAGSFLLAGPFLSAWERGGQETAATGRTVVSG